MRFSTSTTCGFLTVLGTGLLLGCGTADDTTDGTGGSSTSSSTSSSNSSTGSGDTTNGAGGAGGGTTSGMGGGTSGSGGNATSGTGGNSAAGWGAAKAHGCTENSVTALYYHDANDSVWIGCGSGSGAAATSLHMSKDGGENWAVPESKPANVFSGFRVWSLHYGYDNRLYVGGEGPSGVRIVDIDPMAAAPYGVSARYTFTSAKTDFNVRAAELGTDSKGRILASDSTGTNTVWRSSAAIGDSDQDWTALSTKTETNTTNAGNKQYLAMAVHADKFYAGGSTIADQPRVFVPPAGAFDGRLESVALTPMSGLDAWRGEIWGIAVNDKRLVAVGTDQDNDIGKIFLSGADWAASADYTQLDVDASLTAPPNKSTWSRGVCMSGDSIAVVGEYQPLAKGTGWVLLSSDGGLNFKDITPEGGAGGSAQKCQFLGDGRLVVAGSQGWLGFYTP